MDDYTRPSAQRQIVAAVLFLAAVAAIAFFGSLATTPNTDGWYTEVERAPWSPPDWLFGPVWTVIYLLIAIAGFLIWRAGFRGSGRPNAARRSLAIYIAQLVLNSIWSPLFFAGYPLMGEAAWWLALIDIAALIALVVWLLVSATKWSKVSVILLVPYLVWLIFASTLNGAIIALN